MKISPLAGKPAEASLLVNVPRLVTAYYAETPDPAIAEQRVSFGTSGHRGSAFKVSFNERHILAIAQAICLYRTREKIDGPLFLGMDTHALSVPASPRRLRFWRPTAWKSCCPKAMNIRRPPPFRTRSSPTIAVAIKGLPMESSSRLHIIPLMTAASNTTLQTAGRRESSSPIGSRPRRMSFSKTA